ncbi:hypothetical protein [Pedobacter sp. Hv1]|uniref:hypothetical protein n=1 Tax=Pedobacter sp. Hv1 TaxID=1740090 RepID=UPI0006D89FC5|nr:hypothetical protein [Pedobacter sp. Hv1]KQB98716.1 hypothetical protein AQF98_20435 [Pedobacter sp. Hv1]
MKKTLLTLVMATLTGIVYGQTDTIFTNNEKIACVVKEITTDAVKYAFVGEELNNSIYKNAVHKIVFKNGRIQTFTEATSFKNVNSVNDYDNVTITQVEYEIKGLFKLGDASSKAKGTTVLSNQERVKERAYRKLKIQAAIQGGNIIYLTNQRTEGNKFGSEYQSGSSTETNLTGIVYSNRLPSYDNFVKLVKTNTSYPAIQESKLYSSSSDLEQQVISKQFSINSIVNENGLIIINGQLEGVTKYSKFRVVSFTTNEFNIFYEDKSTVYNLKIKL